MYEPAGRRGEARSAGARGPLSRLSLRVDRIKCDGRGYCAELVPEMIRLDDWGYPIVSSGQVPDHLLDHARRAVSACPTLAVRLAEDGRPR
ncbi:MAG: ferredoxin [Candidatus Dormiibacterota bacterium]